MGKKKDKTKNKCCGKYLKSGKHCKGCPLVKAEDGGKKEKKKTKKDKADKKGKKR